jgi:hypothetical protein
MKKNWFLPVQYNFVISLKKHERGGDSPYVGKVGSGIQTEGTCRMKSLRIILLFLLYLFRILGSLLR